MFKFWFASLRPQSKFLSYKLDPLFPFKIFARESLKFGITELLNIYRTLFFVLGWLNDPMLGIRMFLTNDPDSILDFVIR